MKFICKNCNKEFERADNWRLKTFDGICRSCKIRESYYENEEKKELAKKKRKETSIKNLGVDNPAKSEKIKIKIKKTCKEKYGVESSLQLKEIREKTNESSHSKKSYEKRRNTCLKKYGVKHHMQNKKIQEKLRTTYKNFTGFEHPMKNPEIKQKMIKKYGEIGRVKGYYFDNIHFDSSWELAFYIWLTDNNKQFIYHPQFTFEYIGDDEQSHTYLPDFLVEGKFYEIKGTQFFNEKGEPYNMYTKTFWWGKYNSLKENNITILLKDDIKQYLDYVKSTYGKDFLKLFKL